MGTVKSTFIEVRIPQSTDETYMIESVGQSPISM